MIVRELIAELQKLPQDLPVCWPNYEFMWWEDVDFVSIEGAGPRRTMRSNGHPQVVGLS